MYKSSYSIYVSFKVVNLECIVTFIALQIRLLSMRGGAILEL